jgi:hypothetical protein
MSPPDVQGADRCVRDDTANESIANRDYFNTRAIGSAERKTSRDSGLTGFDFLVDVLGDEAQSAADD